MGWKNFKPRSQSRILVLLWDLFRFLTSPPVFNYRSFIPRGRLLSWMNAHQYVSLYFTCLGVVWRSGTTPQSPCISGPAMITCDRSSVTSAAVCLDDSLTSRNTSVKCAATTRTRRSPLPSVASATWPSRPRETCASTCWTARRKVGIALLQKINCFSCIFQTSSTKILRYASYFSLSSWCLELCDVY